MKIIHTYLKDQPDFLAKKFIFFTHNEKEWHWWGWAGINPWCQLAKIIEVRQYSLGTKKKKGGKKQVEFKDVHASGLLLCDGLQASNDTIVMLPSIWFLNLASAYHNMMVEGVFNLFNLDNHTPESYWLLGCRGPFGVTDVENSDRITYPILQRHDKCIPRQNDNNNCGVIWCLFIMDMRCFKS